MFKLIWQFLEPLWGKIVVGMGAIILIQKFLAEVFGITLLGKKIYKGAPSVWKRLMSRAVFRKEVSTMLAEIKAQLDFNGGNSVKDIVTRIDSTQKVTTEVLKDLKSAIDYNAMRLNVFEQSDDRMIFRVNGKGECAFINNSFLRFFGYTERDMLGFNWESIVHQDYIDDVRNKWRRAIETKSNYYSEHKLCDVSGHCYDCVVRAYVILDPSSGDIREFYGTVDLKEFLNN